MQVGDLVQEVMASGIPRRNLLGRVGIVMEVAETIADVTLGRGFGAWVRWFGNVDEDIVYDEDIIILSQVAS